MSGAYNETTSKAYNATLSKEGLVRVVGMFRDDFNVFYEAPIQPFSSTHDEYGGAQHIPKRNISDVHVLDTERRFGWQKGKH